MAADPKTISLNLAAETLPDKFEPTRLTVRFVEVEEDEEMVKYVDITVFGDCTSASAAAGNRDATVRVTPDSALGQTMVNALNAALIDAAKDDSLKGTVA